MKRLIIFLLAVCAQIQSLFNRFAFDDVIQVERNELIRSARSALEYFAHPVYPGDLYRPVTMLSYWVGWAAGGGAPWAQHAINLCLYGIICILIYGLLQSAMNEAAAFAGAALFAVHPVHTEAVASVVGRAELLSSACVLICLRIHQNHGDLRSLFCAGLVFLTGLFSKESAVALIPLLFIVDAWRRPRIDAKRYIPIALVFGSAALVYLYFRSRALGPGYFTASQAWFLDNPLVSLPPGLRMLKASSLLGKYLLLCLFPLNLSADYSYAVMKPEFMWRGSDGYQLLLLGSCTIYALVSFHRDKTFAMGLAWFFAAFSVTANCFFPVGTVFGERLAFLPSAGAIILGAHIVMRIPSARIRGFLLWSAGAAFLLKSFVHAEVWHDDSTLWTYQMNVSARSAKTLQNYGSVLLKRGDIAGALDYGRQAYELFPEYDQAALLQGIAYSLGGRREEAERWLNRTLEISPHHAGALNSLGQIAFNQGDRERALTYFERTLSFEPRNFDALLGKAAVLMHTPEREAGRKILEELLRIDPGNRDVQGILGSFPSP